jgi:cytolysin-activating lysine-acyltransferase
VEEKAMKEPNGKAEATAEAAKVAKGLVDLSPEALAKLIEIRDQLSSSFSKVVMALMATPRYRQLPLADLDWMVLQPLMRDRIAVASAKPADGNEAPLGEQTVGMAIWAKVSEEVSERIAEQARAGVFPARLKSEDWDSGEIVWLLDVIAPNRKLATNVLASFGSIAGEAQVHIHPVVSRAVDPQVLEKLKAKPEAVREEAVSAD